MQGGEFLSINPKNEQHASVCKRMIDKEIIFAYGRQGGREKSLPPKIFQKGLLVTQRNDL